MSEPANSTIVSCPACGARNRVPAVASGRPTCASCHAALPWLVEASEAGFAEAVSGNGLVLVDLWAPWCGPCRVIGPLVERLAAERAGKLKVVKVNVDVAPGVSRRFGVQGIPTLLLLRGGREVSRQVGALPGDRLRAWVDAELAAPASQHPHR